MHSFADSKFVQFLHRYGPGLGRVVVGGFAPKKEAFWNRTSTPFGCDFYSSRIIESSRLTFRSSASDLFNKHRIIKRLSFSIAFIVEFMSIPYMCEELSPTIPLFSTSNLFSLLILSMSSVRFRNNTWNWDILQLLSLIYQ